VGRRDADARPPIEIVGADLGVSSAQHVALGPRGPKRGRGRSLAVGLGLVALLGAGLLLGDDGSDSRRTAKEERDNQDRIDLDKPLTSTTERRTTTTARPTTTTTLPVGPLLGEPAEGALLVYTGATWKRVDLATSQVSDIDLPAANQFDSVAVAGGIAMPSRTGEVWYYPVLGTGAAPEHVVLGPGDRVVRAGSDRVWLLDSPPENQATPDAHVDVRLVELDGELLRSFEIPGRFVSEATKDAVLLSRGGRVYAADETGIRPIATGWLLGTIGDAALVTACDDRGACALESQPTDGGAARVIVEPIDPDTSYFDSIEATDGRLALLEYDQFGGQQRMLLFGPTGASLGVYEPEGQPGTLPVFLPGDLGLLVGGSGGLQRVHEVDGEWRAEELPPVHRGPIEGFFVVTP
jgi:hypothetical protein